MTQPVSFLKGKHILAVDDEWDVIETIQEILDEATVDFAQDYESASQKIMKTQYDIAILDIMGVNGFELLDIANERKVISIMLTAKALSPESTVKAYTRGAAFFVPKDEMAKIGVFVEDVLKAVDDILKA